MNYYLFLHGAEEKIICFESDGVEARPQVATKSKIVLFMKTTILNILSLCFSF